MSSGFDGPITSLLANGVSSLIPTYGKYGGSNYNAGIRVPIGELGPADVPPQDSLDGSFLRGMALTSTEFRTATSPL